MVLLKNGHIYKSGVPDDVISSYLDDSVQGFLKKDQQIYLKDKVSFTGAWLSDTEGEIISCIEGYKEWCINILCKIKGVNFKEFRVYCSISSEKGDLITCVGNVISKDEIISQKNETLIICNIENLMINNGLYYYKLEVVVDNRNFHHNTSTILVVAAVVDIELETEVLFSRF